MKLQDINLRFTARRKDESDVNYQDMNEYGLESTVELMGGTGMAKDPYRLHIGIRNRNQETFTGVIHIELPIQKSNPRFFLPAFMYGRNRGEYPQNVPNEFPRLREHYNRPSSPWWMTRSDRLSHPLALVYDNGRIYGFNGSPYFVKIQGKKLAWYPEVEGEFYQYSGFSCSLEKGTIGYTLGYENAPLLFIQSHDVRERAPLSENCFELLSDEKIEFDLEIYDYEAEVELKINKAMEQVYYKYYQAPRKVSDIPIAVSDIAGAIYRDGWLPEDKTYSGITYLDEQGNLIRNKIISITWTNGLAVAVPILMSAIRLNDEDMRQQALICIQNIIDNTINPKTGLPFEAYNDGVWSNRGWWYDGMYSGGHSSYLIGQALFYILKAYEYEKEYKKILHDDWLCYVKSVIEKIEVTKNTEHEYPFVLSAQSGAGIEYDSLGGAWCMAATAYYSYLVKERTYVDGLIASEEHYYRKFIQRMECYGAPLDTNKAIDSEGILAYIKAVRYIHLLTKDDKYLSHMRGGIDYEFSFKFCYNSPIKVPPLSRIGWSSCGGSVTSVANPHIHPMSSNLIDDLLYYVEQTGDEYVRSRMMDTILWGCQSYNTYDKEYDYGKKGWMSERFCHSEGLVKQKYEDGSLASTWFCLMPWAGGSILDGLAGDYWNRVV